MTPQACDAWPELPYDEWSGTQKSLHLYAQMLGKLRLALSPQLPDWFGARLYTGARWITTGTMPHGTCTVEARIDFVEHDLVIDVSDGSRRKVPLLPARCVAEVWADLLAALEDLGIVVDLWSKPQEIANLTPLDRDRVHCVYDPDYVMRWFAVLNAVENVFDRWRSRFFGRSGVQFWWGSFDLSVVLFSGKRLVPPPGIGYIRRYDADAEHLSAGFWPGNDEAPQPQFYAYLLPHPKGAERQEVRPKQAVWGAGMGEWFLPYDAVREADDPEATLMEFLDSVYEIVWPAAGQDLGDLTYVPPPPPQRR